MKKRIFLLAFFMFILISSLVHAEGECWGEHPLCNPDNLDECYTAYEDCDCGDDIENTPCSCGNLLYWNEDTQQCECPKVECQYGAVASRYCSLPSGEFGVQECTDKCTWGPCELQCGNGVKDAGEECDPRLEGDEAKSQCLGGAGECIQCSCVYAGENEDNKGDCDCPYSSAQICYDKNDSKDYYCSTRRGDDPKTWCTPRSINSVELTRKCLICIGDFHKDCRRCDSSSGKFTPSNEGKSCENGKGICKDGYCIPKCANPDKLEGEWACVPNEGDKTNKGVCTKDKSPGWDTGIGCEKQVKKYLELLSKTGGYLNGKVSSEQIKNFDKNFYWGCSEKGGAPECYVGRFGAWYGKWP